MKNYIYICLFSLLSIHCQAVQKDKQKCICNDQHGSTFSVSQQEAAYRNIQGALLGTRFRSLDELRSVISIEYYNNNGTTQSTLNKNARVVVKHCSNGKQVESILEAGVSQTDISSAEKAGLLQRMHFILKAPYAVACRKDLEKVFLLARLRPALFGEGDVAFFNIAESMVENINTPELAFINERDSTEKGYLNTFNHMTAQAFITSCFSEKLADFVADAHEKAYHPELISGTFSDAQKNDLQEGPVDNYVDIINNEWGQELGKELAVTFEINRQTVWTAALLADYLNAIQSYYSRAFQIGFTPFRPQDEKVYKFARKLNAVMNGATYADYE